MMFREASVSACSSLSTCCNCRGWRVRLQATRRRQCMNGCSRRAERTWCATCRPVRHKSGRMACGEAFPSLCARGQESLTPEAIVSSLLHPIIIFITHMHQLTVLMACMLSLFCCHCH